MSKATSVNNNVDLNPTLQPRSNTDKKVNAGPMPSDTIEIGTIPTSIITYGPTSTAPSAAMQN